MGSSQALRGRRPFGVTLKGLGFRVKGLGLRVASQGSMCRGPRLRNLKVRAWCINLSCLFRRQRPWLAPNCSSGTKGASKMAASVPSRWIGMHRGSRDLGFRG